MSLTSPRVVFPSIALALAALMVASCGQQNLPTSPSAASALMGQPQVVTELFIDLVDPTPPPPAGLEKYKLLDEPAPPPPSGSGPEPWPPGPPPRAQPGVPVPTEPSTNERLHVKIDPEPVPHSGTPVGTFSCRDNRFTWYYDQVIATDTGVPIKITKRENYFDGRYVNKNEDSFSVGGNSSVTIHTRWCSGWPRPHYTQTKFFGSDDYGKDFVFSAPWVRLLTP